MAPQHRNWLRIHGIDPIWKKSQPQIYFDLYSKIPAYARMDVERRFARFLHHELDLLHGRCKLRHPCCATLVHDALLHFQGDRVWVGDFVIMPNHVHAILQPRSGHELEDLLESVKKFTARRIQAMLRPSQPMARRSSFWQAESYDRIIRDREELSAYRRYIAQNPVTSHLREGEFKHHVCDWLP